MTFNFLRQELAEQLWILRVLMHRQYDGGYRQNI